jgi:hypothetical protein
MIRSSRPSSDGDDRYLMRDKKLAPKKTFDAM